MSRSYKKNPYCTDQSTPKGKKSGISMKRFANKKVRHSDVPIRERAAFKKIFCSWDICDYKFRKTIEEAITEWELEEQEFPRYESHYERSDEVDEKGYPKYKKVWVYVEEGPLHKEYGNLKRCLQKYWAKYYKRK